MKPDEVMVGRVSGNIGETGLEELALCVFFFSPDINQRDNQKLLTLPLKSAHIFHQCTKQFVVVLTPTESFRWSVAAL